MKHLISQPDLQTTPATMPTGAELPTPRLTKRRLKATQVQDGVVSSHVKHAGTSDEKRNTTYQNQFKTLQAWLNVQKQGSRCLELRCFERCFVCQVHPGRHDLEEILYSCFPSLRLQSVESVSNVGSNVWPFGPLFPQVGSVPSRISGLPELLAQREEQHTKFKDSPG